MKKFLCVLSSAAIAVMSAVTSVSAKEAALKEGMEMHGNMCGSVKVVSETDTDINVRVLCETPDMPETAFYDETIGAADTDNTVDFKLEGNDDAVYTVVVSAPQFKTSKTMDQEQTFSFKVKDTDEIADGSVSGYTYIYTVKTGDVLKSEINSDAVKGEDNIVKTDTTLFFPITDGVRGDANSDGKLSVRDCAAIAKALATKAVDSLPATADFNGDGKVTVRDAAAIANYLANQKA